MKDTALYEQLLGLNTPWSVKKVDLDKVTRIITDAGIDQGIHEKLEKLRVALLVASPNDASA